MFIGAMLPQFHSLSGLVQPLLMVMLFFAFMDVDFKPSAFPKSVAAVSMANIIIAFVGYTLLAPFDTTLAISAFMTAIAPTAIAAPVIIGFLRGKVEYVVASVLLTNLANAIIIPLALPSLIGKQVHITVWDVLQPVLFVMFVPLILAQLAVRTPAPIQAVIRRAKAFSFPIWLANLFVISANASDFLRNRSTDSLSTLGSIALVSLVICVINFSLGAFLGGKLYRQEASQSLGQKNLSFVIWISLTFINPLVALGPMFYILYHHLFNSWSIYQFEKNAR